VSLPIGLGGGGGYAGSRGKGDKGLALPLTETIRLAWQDPDLRQRILFVLFMFAVFALGVHVPVPVPGVSSDTIMDKLKNMAQFQFLDMFAGGALRRLSIFALGLTPYITASIIMQILQTALPNLKKEMQEGGEYARKQNNKRTRMLTLALCVIQGFGLLTMLGDALPANLGIFMRSSIVVFWTAGAMFQLWLGEQISEKGIGNGVSLMIFAGIILSLPQQTTRLYQGYQDGVVQWYSPVIILLLFLAATWLIVFFTTAQRRIPIQHMKRTVGTKVMGGQTSYLPLSVNMAGVLPIIFAVSLIGMPLQFGSMFGGNKTPVGSFLLSVAEWLSPGAPFPKGIVGSIIYTLLIFFFTYFWTAIQYNVEDIANNLKRGGSFIPSVRPGKQTKDFLDGVISRITVVGAGFIAIVALMQYISPQLAHLPPGQYISVMGGTSLLIMVSVALETMRQIEANLLMKQYGS
jgi:preprotein translocase subunit SecY